ncbi:CDP-glucose 4,6-dehydratase [Hymenobacter sp. BT770]|uniref:CDP-glucose 4,6-dehydratase n=1 Tax=Hymenobacter sp. BT770 TaxID=2886942 RepID=UPI001D0F5387|nr:CDP-glucose 4,6-dehydratase [Hymenobacter sp. BT770]MCC3153813.1 CDP-glucose 4,6-dehydratase [Hymenobacter sp. BT770]MDO3415957.1 CDP-glucose 4,6-dehydratase [Hymenobacter sp. BT770]
MDFQSIYHGKKVFLTGHTGFKGAWLLQWLHLLGAEVKGYALAPDTEEALYSLIAGDALCESVIADLRDAPRLERELLSFQPDFVFHLAAQPLVRLSYEMPAETFSVNAIGTAYVLEAVRKLAKPCTVVLITTDKVYENKEWLYPYRETDRLGGYDPYSASKACAELVIHSYTQSFFNPAVVAQHQKGIASARAGNVIGGGDWAKDRIIPDIVRALRAERPVTVRNPLAVRPWQHVLEPLKGYLLLGAKLAANPVQYGGSWNFGPYADDNKIVEELVQAALKIWGSGTYEKPVQIGQPHEAGLLKLDISKAVSELAWKPQHSADKAIAKTLQWYKAYHEQPEGIKQFTVQQINAFASHDS